MKHAIGYGLLLGAALVVGAGVAVAQMGSPPPSRTSAPAESFGSYTPGRSRLAERFLEEYDTNKDGKVTHDEFNRTLAHEFSVATNGAPTMTLDQYTAVHLKDMKERAPTLFHSMDWNGDGKLSLDEYMAAERTRFEYLDRDGTGAISCRSSRGRSADTGQPRASRSDYSDTSSRGSGGSSRGRTSLCYTDDLNKDGQVTRAEFDKITAQQFNTFAKGGYLTQDQFFQMLFTQSRDISERVFRRLDRDRTGKITLQEWAASQERLFTRLDKNNDGVVTADELSSSRRGRTASRN